ncbi:MAG: alpha/beta fold hydrolase [Catenulispora sp.]|nr:alpha/beta fold hydrolase [Catenulispora sp.]
MRTRDGRRLAVESWGPEHGVPVFLLHGMPGSRVGPRPRESLLYRLGARLIAYDRPGYGESDRLRRRAVADAAPDVAAIADELGLPRFAVLGRSGGGPHALACAGLLPDRVTRVAVLTTLAPRDADGLDWYAGMTASNVAAFLAAETDAGTDAGTFGVRLEARAALLRRDPAANLPFRDAELSVTDRRVVGDAGIRAMLLQNFAEAVKTSGVGWVDDVRALASAWGFDPAAVAVPVLFWHGAEDVHSPVSHMAWLAERIRGSRLVVADGTAHFGALEVLPAALAWLVDAGDRVWPAA